MTTTTAVTTTTTATFERYLALAEKALQKSRKSVDTRALIQLAYGDDTTHIGGSDMLMDILDSVLDKITNETVMEELKCFGSSSTAPIHSIEDDERKEIGEQINENEHATVSRIIPEERMDKIDKVISYVINWEERRDQIEGLDAKSARGSINQNLLPEGVTMENVVSYREHEQRLQARAALKLELQRIEDETLVLQNQSNEKEKKVREQLGRVGKVERELEASANVCAMVTI